jgi:uncharacterized membrane protein YsdA (DUF1294 family)
MMGVALAFLSGHVLWLAGVYVVASLAGFVCMGLDKSRARRQAWRIPERTLLALAVFDGAAGVLTGMWLFRHKTRHTRFRVLVSMLSAAQAVFLLWLILRY